MNENTTSRDRKLPDRPNGELILRTIAMPANTNPSGDIFGGWIMSQMDIAGGMMARELTGTRIVTVAADSIVFIRPVRVGDTVCCYGRILKVGKTSLTINLEVWVRPGLPETGLPEHYLVTHAAMTYVSVDGDGKKQLVNHERIEGFVSAFS
jgi:acyl-CoA thioesterase YciA